MRSSLVREDQLRLSSYCTSIYILLRCQLANDVKSAISNAFSRRSTLTSEHASAPLPRLTKMTSWFFLASPIQKIFNDNTSFFVSKRIMEQAKKNKDYRFRNGQSYIPKPVCCTIIHLFSGYLQLLFQNCKNIQIFPELEFTFPCENFQPRPPEAFGVRIFVWR